MSAKDRRPGRGTEAAETFAGVTPTLAPPSEPSAWLRQRVAERVAYVRQCGLDPDTRDPVIIGTLGRPGVPGEPSDRECDRCQRVTPVGLTFHTAVMQVRPGLTLIGGLCAVCAAAEGWVTR